MNNSKSQTAVEYLILLAVVIVVALVVVNTLGGFPGIGSNNNKKVADYKLQSGAIGIESYSIGANSSVFKIKNNYYETVTLNEFRVNQQANLTCNSSNTIPSLPIVLNIGQSVIVNCTAVNSSSYSLTNKQTPLVGLLYADSITSNRLAGNVESYGNTSTGIIVSEPYIPSQNVYDLRQGLVAYYPFDGNTSDLSGNGNEGINNGATYTASGKVGGAYTFDGSNDYIHLSDTSFILNKLSNYTISAWINDNKNDYGDYNVFSETDGTGPKIMLNSRSNQLFFGVNGDDTWWREHYSGVEMFSGWHLLTITVSDNSVLNFYTDGNLDGVVNDDFHNSVYTITTTDVGYSPTINYAPFSGFIDEVSIWNRTLNLTEVSQLYNESSGLSLSLSGAKAPDCATGQTNCSGTNYLTCSNGNWVNNGNVTGQCAYAPPGNVTQLRQGLVAYYPLNGNTSDMSGHGYNGVSSGATYTPTGKVSGAYDFSGNGGINVNNGLITAANANFTTSVWVNPSFNSYSGDTTILTNQDDNGNGNNGFVLAYRNDAWNAFYGAAWSGWQGVDTCTMQLPSNTWSMVSFSKNNNNLSIYLNGINFCSSILTSTYGNVVSNFALGKYPTQDIRFFTGKIDEVSIWNRSLNSTEVAQMYNGSNGFNLVQ